MGIQTVQPDIYFSVAIDGHEEANDGSVVVYGIPCKPNTLDVDGQIVDPAWLKGALTRWYQTGPNIREMHQPSAVGVGTNLDWQDDTPYLSAKIVDPVAAKKVREGVYRAFSIGVKNHVLKLNDPQAPNGRIVGGDIVETTICDRPAIPGADILDFKADLFKIASAISPTEVLDHQHGVVWERRTLDLPYEGDDMAKTASGDVAKRDMDPDVGGGVDRDKIPAEDFAGKDRSYPIVEPKNVHDAAQSIGRAGADNYSPAELRENIIRIAKRKGPSFVAELPEAWKDDKEDKVADATDEKMVDAATELKAADGDAEKDAEGEKPNPLAAFEEKAARSVFCADCQKSVEIENGKTFEHDGHSFLVGKDAAGHDLTKFIAPGEAKSAVDEAAAEAALEAIDAIADNALDDGDEDEPEAGASHEVVDETAAVPAAPAPSFGEDASMDYSADSDVVKAALASLLLEAGIDLGKIGRRMAKSRLDRMHAAIDELKSLAAELGDDDGLAKSAQAGNDLYTRMEACVSEIQSLARQMAFPGSDVEDTEEGGSDMGRASEINPADMSLKRAVEPDMKKTTDTPMVPAQDQLQVLAKAVAAELEKATAPLVERLGKVEHTLVPPSPPVLSVEERESAFVGKQADARRMATEEALAELRKMSDTEREHALAALLANNPAWRGPQ